MCKQQNEIEYIEPTQEHVGQVVEVRPIGNDEWQRAKLVGIAHDEYRFTAKRSHDNYGICWKYARIPCPKPQATQEPPTNPIDWTKPVRTKLTKWPVTLVTVKGRGDYPVVGYVGDNTDLSQWNLQGNKPGRGDDPDGLENPPQRIQREYWVNVYPSGIGYNETKYLADEVRTSNCLACVKITIDCEEGEGL